MPKGRQTLVNRRKSDSNQKVSPKQRRDSVKEIATKRTVKKRERRVVRRKVEIFLSEKNYYYFLLLDEDTA